MTKEEEIEAAWRTHKETPYDVYARHRKEKTLKQNNLCFYCKEPFTSERRPTIDHIVPRASGGLNHEDNYVVACYECNQKKGSKSFDDFVQNFLIEANS